MVLSEILDWIETTFPEVGLSKEHVKAWKLLDWLGDHANRQKLEVTMGTIKERIQRIPLAEFVSSWRIVRQLTSLQGRLFIEQAMWDMGYPYRLLVTGFGPIDLSKLLDAAQAATHAPGEGYSFKGAARRFFATFGRWGSREEVNRWWWTEGRHKQ